MSSEVDFAAKQLDLLAWLEKNKSRLIGGLAALMVVGVVVASIQRGAHNKQIAASTALATLGYRTDEKGEIKEPTAADYLAIVEQHPGTGAAERALVLAAGALFTEGDLDGAAARFNEYISSYPTGPYQSIARMGKAACADAKGSAEQAIGEYKLVEDTYPTEPVAEQAKLARAYLLEKTDKPAEALAIYDQMIDSVGGSALASEASQKRSQLLKLHPELEPQPEASAAMPSLGGDGSPIDMQQLQKMVQDAAGKQPAATAPAATAPAATAPAEKPAEK